MGWEGRGREGEDKESPLPIAAREAFVKREKRRGMEGGGRRATGKYTRPTSHHPLRRPFAPRIGFRFDVMPDTTRRLLVQRLIFLLLVFVFSKTALQRFPNILNISSRMTTQGRRPSKADKKTTERKKKRFNKSSAALEATTYFESRALREWYATIPSLPKSLQDIPFLRENERKPNEK